MHVAGSHGAWRRPSGRQARGWVALFALLVQLLGSYGHVHPDGLRRSAGELTAAERSRATPLSGNGNPALPARDACALCLSIELIGSAALPEAVALTLPHLPAMASETDGTELRLTPPPYLLFHTTGPPLA
jgi:hypothetical protein